MKKRFIYILLVLALVMTGCGRKVEENDVVSDSQVVVQATDALVDVPERTAVPVQKAEAPEQTEKPAEATKAPVVT